MELKNGTFCPLIKKDCIQLKCSFFILLRGRNPNTGKDIDEWMCSISAMPMLMINTANEVRQGAAATESFRNEVMKASQKNDPIENLIKISERNRQALIEG